MGANELTSDDAVRQAVRAWLGEHYQPQKQRGAHEPRDANAVRAFLEATVDSGWAAPAWPVESFGKGLTAATSRIVDEEFRRVGAPGSGQDVANLWAATIVSHASDELRDEVLRKLMLGDINMCLLYSEPGAGSDLAAVQTRAERDGDEWVINGQKVWTSSGRQAQYALLITRTNLDVPKHRGITFFFMPMNQPGVEVRPLRQATGDSRFNEVFLTDARVPHANMLGTENNGWMVLQTALAYERAAMGQVQRRRVNPGADPGADPGVAHAVRDATDEASAPVPNLVLTDLARTVGVLADPTIRQDLARLHCLRMVNEWNGARGKAAMEKGTSSPTVSLGKLAMSGILHFAGSLQARILGAEAMLGGTDSPEAADASYSMLNAFFTSIGGGTDQIQRNIIGERLLGLPKEPEIDKDVPFREVRKAVVANRT